MFLPFGGIVLVKGLSETVPLEDIGHRFPTRRRRQPTLWPHVMSCQMILSRNAVSPIWPPRFTDRKIGPSLIPPAEAHPSIAARPTLT